MNTMTARKLFKASSYTAIFVAMTAGALVACSPAKWRETKSEPKAPNTGDPIAERQTAPRPIADPKAGDKGYVNPDRLCGRRIGDRECDQDSVVVERNDEVVVKDPKPKGPDQLIEVEVTKSSVPNAPKTTIYVPPEYINSEPAEPSMEELAADRYFVVQNIATEKLRVYERCGGSGQGGVCKHRLILETDMVIGQNTSSRRSLLGSYRITKWFKFYEDNRSSYPSWYQNGYPQTPAAGSDLNAWASSALLPSGRGSLRGSFGWYTAHIAPNAEEQWTHGTWGWGKDGDAFIQKLRQSPTDRDGRFTSHGCTRVENQAIAMMREILVPGTKVIKIYALESYRNPELGAGKMARGTWDWILTNEDANQEDGARSGRASVTQRGTPKSAVLEAGRYRFSATPVAVALNESSDPHTNGNSYGIAADAFRGVFLVEEGRVLDYRHPRGLRVGGHPGAHLPSVILAGGASEVVPAPLARRPVVAPVIYADEASFGPQPEVYEATAPARIQRPDVRPDVRMMSCLAAQDLVKRHGAIVMTTGDHTYDRFVADQSKCMLSEKMQPAHVLSGDSEQCFVGYTCAMNDNGAN